MTAVPAAFDGLFDLLGSWDDLAGVRVDDGPWIDEGGPSELDVIVVGCLPLPNTGPVVAWSGDADSLSTDGETFSIRGWVSSWSGDTTMKPARDRACVLLEAVRAAVASDRTLGGAVSTSRLTAMNLTPYQVGNGSAVSIEFTISAQVY